jgi:GntR family transcriptional regulator
MSPDSEPELILHGGVAIAGQIATQIRDCIVSGRLRSGEQLPTVRQVAVELAVNPDAVRTAYGVLEREGLLTSAEGCGTFVAACPQAVPGQPGRGLLLQRLCEQLLARAARYGFSSGDILETLLLLSNGGCHEESR